MKIVGGADALRFEDLFEDLGAADEDEAIGFDLLTVRAKGSDVSEFTGVAQIDGDLLDVVEGSAVVGETEAFPIQFHLRFHDFSRKYSWSNKCEFKVKRF